MLRFELRDSPLINEEGTRRYWVQIYLSPVKTVTRLVRRVERAE